MVKIAPSILSADFNHMEQSIRLIERAGADYVHCDIMDGVFVPNISFGFPVVESVRRITKLPLDVHLMIVEPERYVERFAEAGADVVTFHVEATNHVQRVLSTIHGCGKLAGVVLNPATPIDYVRYILDDVDMILLMTVNPGYGGQKFIPAMLRKITDLKMLVASHGKNIDIEVDGGISSANAVQVIEAGADVIVAGSAFFNAEDPGRELRLLRGEA